MLRQPSPLHFSEAPWFRQDCLAFDRALQAAGLPAPVLMELAAREISTFLMGSMGSKDSGSVCFLCGPGNNGADGIAAARQMLGSPQATPLVCLPFGLPAAHSLLEHQLRLYQRLGGAVAVGWSPMVSSLAQPHQFWVDALFGIGLQRPMGNSWENCFTTLSTPHPPILAVDCPSGLNCDTGTLFGTTLKATWTLSFVALKAGFFLQQGPNFCGEIQVVDLGVHHEIAARWKREGHFGRSA